MSVNSLFARLALPDVVHQELPALGSEPLTLPVKSVFVVGQKLTEQLAKLSRGVERGLQEQAVRAQLIGRVVTVSGMALSAGFVAWLVRADGECSGADVDVAAF